MSSLAVTLLEGRDSAPQGLNVALLDPLAQCSDALNGVVAIPTTIDTAELILVQTATRITSIPSNEEV